MGFEPIALVLAMQCSNQLSYEDPYIGSRPICWVHPNLWKEWHTVWRCELEKHKIINVKIWSSQWWLHYLSLKKVFLWISITLQLLKLQLPLISSQKFVFLQFTSSISVLFLSRVKMYSTNWPAPNVWVFIAQLVRVLQRLCRGNEFESRWSHKNFFPGYFAINYNKLNCNYHWYHHIFSDINLYFRSSHHHSVTDICLKQWMIFQ